MDTKTFLRKVHKRIFERGLGKLFYQEQKDFLNDKGLMKYVVRYINQKITESGHSAPWVYTKQECLDFWRSIDNKHSSTGNRPEAYAKKAADIIGFLHNFWSPQVKYDDSILELGCNCGSNLHWLHKMGYKNLSGMEINPEAVEQAYISFPGMKGAVNISLGSIEELLPKMPSKSVDAIFTMGVSMHIHPSDNFLFREMRRVARKHICTMEPESANSNYVFARNYRRVFRRLGCHQLKSSMITKEAFPKVNYEGCVARLFLSAGE
ncbi:MAG: methyltransferase domain-containing protein [Candidatus Aureabacteria bacterium]|nr:methyltransferase domain-containing protein [Candidatus Auribacterota bacterium]